MEIFCGARQLKEWKVSSIKTRKITTAVREASVSRHHGDQFKGPSETPPASHHYGIKGLRGTLNWSPIMPSDANYAIIMKIHTSLFSTIIVFMNVFSLWLINGFAGNITKYTSTKTVRIYLPEGNKNSDKDIYF